jgi:DNA-directed RNA polymerase specialized sigma24 family protein
MAQAIPTATFAAHRAGRRQGLPQADQDDLRQTILLAILLRSHHYDRDRGAQSTFLKIVTRSAITDHQRSTRGRMPGERTEALLDETAAPGDPEADLLQRISLSLVLASLPPPLLRVVALIAEWGSAAEAYRASGQPLCTFYRQLREVRMRLRLAGLSVTP